MNAGNWVLIGALMIAGAAHAQDTRSKTIERENGDLTVNWGPAPALPSQGAPNFDSLDSNDDGRLSLTETETHRLLHSDFIYADSNRNGSISRAELQRWR